jgi:hypothetical protein
VINGDADEAEELRVSGLDVSGMKTGFVVTPYFAIPLLIRSTPKSMTPPISIAPQKVISPSP